MFAISKSQADRILADLTPRLAVLLDTTVDRDRRWSWIVDGTLVPTRDHAAAARSKNYRWSCNVQLLMRRRDLQVIAVAGGGPRAMPPGGVTDDVGHASNTHSPALGLARST